MGFSQENARIAFFGGSNSQAAIEGVARLAQSGFHIVAGDHTPQEAIMLHAAGIPMVRSRGDALSNANVVITSCEGTEQLEDLMLGPNNLLEQARPNTFFVDLTVIPVQLAREISAMAELQACNVVDAPLVNLGEHEKSAVFMGGVTADVNAVAPLMPYFADRIFTFGGRAGMGQAGAMCALISFAGSMMGLVEAMALGRLSGLSVEHMFDSIGGTLGGSRAMVEFAQRVLNADFEGRILVRELLFWLDAALEGAESLGVTAPVLESAYSLCDLLACVGGEHLSVQALALLYEDEATCAKHGLNWTLAQEREDYQRAREALEQTETSWNAPEFRSEFDDWDMFGDDAFGAGGSAGRSGRFGRAGGSEGGCDCGGHGSRSGGGASGAAGGADASGWPGANGMFGDGYPPIGGYFSDN